MAGAGITMGLGGGASGGKSRASADVARRIISRLATRIDVATFAPWRLGVRLFCFSKVLNNLLHAN
jgi:hypothetical protein